MNWLDKYSDDVSKAQNGKATRADSLFLLNNNKIIKNLEKSGYEWTGKRDNHNNKVLWKQQYKVLEKHLPELIAKDIKLKQKTKPYNTYIDKRGKLLGTQDWLEFGNEDYYMPKQYIHPDIIPQFDGDLKRKNKDKVHSIYSYGYDDLAITPFDMLTPEQKKLRVQKYGTDGVPKSYIKGIKDKLNKDPEVIPTNDKPILQPKVEAVNIQPIEQRPIIPNQQIDVRTTAQMPSSFDVSMQRYNMEGPSDYYQANEKGVDYEKAMEMKIASDAYNRDIEKRYGPQNEYRTEKSRQEAARRLEKLRQDVKVRPNYQNGGQSNMDGLTDTGFDYNGAWGGQFQMGGYVYPVNYVPQAQMGGSIPGAVGFSYARTQSPAPSNGPYAKKTKASAQNGETLQYGTPEYKKAYDENRVAYYDKDSDTYINQELDPVEVEGRVRDKGFWEQYVDKIVEENRGASPLEAAIGVPISAVSSLPQLAATYAFTDKVQRPSEAMDIENPYLAMGTDFVLDPLNATGTGVLTREQALARLAASKESGLLSNAYKYNPWAFKSQKGKIYRQVGKPGFDDAMKEGKIYDKGQKEFLENYPDINYLDEYNKAINAKGFYLKKPSTAPFFAKDDLFFPINRKATGKGNQKTRFSDAEYLFEGDVPNEALLPRYRDAYLSPEQSGRTFVLRPEYNDLSNFNVYKRDWLQGYKQIPKQEDGGVIKDDLGQWAHPGEITEIGSNQITMQGVPYPVLGISDTGDMQMMYPEEEYEFDGESVTEYPMAKNGIRQEQKGLVNLDQLTNFTNYNTKQPGGWLDNY